MNSKRVEIKNLIRFTIIETHSKIGFRKPIRKHFQGGIINEEIVKSVRLRGKINQNQYQSKYFRYPRENRKGIASVKRFIKY